MDCEGCELELEDFCTMCKNEVELLEWLKKHGVIARAMHCPRCGKPCKTSEGRYYCHSKFNGRHCTFQQSTRKGSWFECASLTVDSISQLTVMWTCISPPRHEFFKSKISASSNTVASWSAYCRGVCLDWAMRSRQQLGGPGKVVELDEAKLGSRSRSQGRAIEGLWLFGGFERESNKIFIVPVAKRSKESLLEVVKKWILPGTTIISCCWRALNCMPGNEYNALNVDPDTGPHTDLIEKAWREVWIGEPRFERKEPQNVGSLAEFMWKRTWPNHGVRPHEFFKLIATLYDPYEILKDNVATSPRKKKRL